MWSGQRGPSSRAWPVWGEEEANRHREREPELGCTWSCRLFLWTQAPAMPPLGKGRCKGKDALKGEEPASTPSASPGRSEAAREQLVLTSWA